MEFFPSYWYKVLQVLMLNLYKTYQKPTTEVLRQSWLVLHKIASKWVCSCLDMLLRMTKFMHMQTVTAASWLLLRFWLEETKDFKNSPISEMLKCEGKGSFLIEQNMVFFLSPLYLPFSFSVLFLHCSNC